jgi:hypothetical protein
MCDGIHRCDQLEEALMHESASFNMLVGEAAGMIHPQAEKWLIGSNETGNLSDTAKILTFQSTTNSNGSFLAIIYKYFIEISTNGCENVRFFDIFAALSPSFQLSNEAQTALFGCLGHAGPQQPSYLFRR